MCAWVTLFNTFAPLYISDTNANYWSAYEEDSKEYILHGQKSFLLRNPMIFQLFPECGALSTNSSTVCKSTGTVWSLLQQPTEGKTCVSMCLCVCLCVCLCCNGQPGPMRACATVRVCECYQESLWLNSRWIAQIQTKTAAECTSASVCVQDLVTIRAINRTCQARLAAFGTPIIIIKCGLRDWIMIKITTHMWFLYWRYMDCLPYRFAAATPEA